MPLLIDGHNLIGYLSSIALEDPDDEEQLIRLLISYRARTGKSITVVFDPGSLFALPRNSRHGGVEVVFAPHRTTADEIILRRLRRAQDRRGWQVVTSDQKLAEEVAQLGARVSDAGSFAAELGPAPGVLDDSKGRAPSPEEVESWLALFEEGRGEVGRDSED